MFRKRSQSVLNNILYHGSPQNLEKLSPRPNKRINEKIIEWNDKAIFVTPDYRIALHYTANKLNQNTQIFQGVNLREPIDKNEPVVFQIIGGESCESALDQLYGCLDIPESCKGYIYHINGNFCAREVGLGANEKVTRDEKALLFKQEINRRELLREYVASGQIILSWMNDLEFSIPSPVAKLT